MPTTTIYKGQMIISTPVLQVGTEQKINFKMSSFSDLKIILRHSDAVTKELVNHVI